MNPEKLTREEKQRIYEVMGYVLNHLNKQFTIKELARRAALGEQKFKDGFCKLFEFRIGEYIHRGRVQLGKFLLTKTNKSIKEIASLCGYSKTRNFSSAYKKVFGVCPKNERSF